MNTRANRWTFLGAALVAACVSVLALLPPSTVSGAAASTRPAKEGFTDDWLGRAALDELQAAVAGGKLPELKERMNDAVLARLSCGHLDQLEALNTMIYVLAACGYLPTAREACDEKFAKWLAENRGVSRLLFRALEDVRQPKESLKALQELVADDEKTVLEYPHLAVAFATTKPRFHPAKAPAAPSRLESFRWYTKSKQSFRYDLKAMPYELSRYVSDIRVSIAERQWAMQNYGSQPNPARCYFDVKYDYDHYKTEGVPKKIAKLDYTLQNLRQVGGICVDQAYYASQVCKAIGVPATVVSGHGSTGMGHAWVASLKVSPDGKQAVWDAATGRYEEQQYFTGDLHDPASGKMILDSELMLVGAAAQLPLQRREEAHTATTLAEMVDAISDAPRAADFSVLGKLAEDYNKRHAGETGLPKADAGQFKAERKLDGSLVEDLIDAAIQRNLAHRPAWDLIVELSKTGRLPVEHLDRFFNILVERTARQFPDYSAASVLRIVPSIPDAARREKVYQKALGVYGSRPDLQGRILVALGDEYAAAGQKEKALATLEQAAMKCVNVSEVVLAAAGKAEGLLNLAGDRGKEAAIKMYAKLFGMTKASKSAFRAQTSHYQLGKRLADLLTEAGRDAEAKQVLKRIED